jgi:hypothetical protein
MDSPHVLVHVIRVVMASMDETFARQRFGGDPSAIA